MAARRRRAGSQRPLWIDAFWDTCLQNIQRELVICWVKEFIIMSSNVLQLSNFEISLCLHLFL